MAKCWQLAIHYGLKRLKIRYKKKALLHPKANEEASVCFKEKISAYEKAGKEIVYLDESGFAQCMPRLYGYAKLGSRCYGKHDWHARGRVNVIVAIIGATFVTLNLFSCYINLDEFYE